MTRQQVPVHYNASPRGITPHGPTPRRARRAYSLIELLMIVLIIQMITGFVICGVSSANSTARLDQVMKRSISALRYARMVAMSSGQPCSVEFNATTNTIKVFLGASNTPVSNALFPNGQMAISLASDNGVSGTTIAGVSNAGAAPYRCTYGVMGTRTNAPNFSQPMTVTFAYGSTTSTLTIPNAGEPN